MVGLGVNGLALIAQVVALAVIVGLVVCGWLALRALLRMSRQRR